VALHDSVPVAAALISLTYFVGPMCYGRYGRAADLPLSCTYIIQYK